MERKRRTAAALMFLLMLLSAGCKKMDIEESYRNVKVLETTGEAYVVRSQNQMPVYEQMIIQGGDLLTTDQNGRVDLKLDDDKYVVVEEASQVEFELEGDQEKGAIRLMLKEGAVYNEIENPLAEDDSYEIHTPDGVMAVRGTKFRIAISQDEGVRETKITVLDGKVYVQVDNEKKEDAVIMAGEEAVIEKNMESETENEEQTSPRFKKRENTIRIDELPDYLVALASESSENNQEEAVETGAEAAVSRATAVPTQSPTPMPRPTLRPTAVPTAVQNPTATLVPEPTVVPTLRPTAVPTANPTAEPTSRRVETTDSNDRPAAEPVETPTETPSATPATVPTEIPTTVPTEIPTTVPTEIPTTIPTTVPTEIPTTIPTTVPAAVPTETTP